MLYEVITLKLDGILDRIDAYIDDRALLAYEPEPHPSPILVPDPPGRLDLGARGISTIILAVFASPQNMARLVSSQPSYNFV